MSLRSSRHMGLGALAALLSSLQLGCPGPEPATTLEGAGGDDAISSTGPGGPTSTGPGPQSSSATSSTSGPGVSSTGAGGDGGAGAAGDGGAGAAGDGGAGGAGDGGAGDGGSASGGHGGEGGEGGSCVLGDVDNCGACNRKCGKQHVLEGLEPACIAGDCYASCELGYADLRNEVSEPDDGCETQGRLVFVTSGTYAIPFGGVDAANELCQGLGASLGGSWKAWISDGGDGDGSQPSAWVEEAGELTIPYLRVDNAVVAENWEDLVDGSLENPINLTELGLPSGAGTSVWTGTDSSGNSTGNNCSDWSNGAVSQINRGDRGSPGEAGPEWTQQTEPGSCGGVARLYCFQQ